MLGLYAFDLAREAGPKGSVTTTSRCVTSCLEIYAHRFTFVEWEHVNGEQANRIIVAGMANEEHNIWDPEKIVAIAE